MDVQVKSLVFISIRKESVNEPLEVEEDGLSFTVIQVQLQKQTWSLIDVFSFLVHLLLGDCFFPEIS